MSDLPLSRRHHQRLRELYRSAGWPFGDAIEVELLAHRLLARFTDAQGRETLRVTDAGIELLAQVFALNRSARSLHETLVERVAHAQAVHGRLVWRGLALRAPVPREGDTDASDWVLACPDVFSIRRSSREDLLEPVVHEIKVSRADLRADLRRSNKRAAYLAMSCACWYVLGQDARGRPVGTAADVPVECGVLQADGQGLHVLREAPRRAVARLPLHVWLALAQATPLAAEAPQQHGL